VTLDVAKAMLRRYRNTFPATCTAVAPSSKASSPPLNAVGLWFALIIDRMIRRGTFLNVHELEQAI